MLFYTIDDVVDLTKLSSATIRRKVRDGSFPRPFKITSRRTVWRPEDVRLWADQITNDADQSDEKSTSWLSRFA